MWTTCRTALIWASLVCQSFAGPSRYVSHSDHVARRAAELPRQDASLTPFVTAQNASASDIEAARQIVKDAIAKMTVLNKARLDNPSRNNYKLKPGTRTSKRDGETSPPPLLEITTEIAQAAALVAELDVEPASNVTQDATVQKRAAAFWMESLGSEHKGSVPWGDDKTYRVRIADIDVWEVVSCC